MDTLMSSTQVALAAMCGVAAVVLVVALVRDRRPGLVFLGFLGLVELGLLAHLVIGFLALDDDPGEVSAFTFGGYLVGVLVILPAAVSWAAGERSRSGTAVLLVGVLVVPFLLLRTHDIWVGGHLG